MVGLQKLKWLIFLCFFVTIYSNGPTVYWPSLSTIRRQCDLYWNKTCKSLEHVWRWVTNHTCDEDLNATNTVDKTEAFYFTIHEAIDRHFPTKVVKLHTTDKPWITPVIKLHIKKHQKSVWTKKKKKKRYTCGALCAIILLAWLIVPKSSTIKIAFRTSKHVIQQGGTKVSKWSLTKSNSHL